MGGANLDTLLEVVLGMRKNMKQMAREMSNINEKLSNINCGLERIGDRLANIGEHLKASYPSPNPMSKLSQTYQI